QPGPEARPPARRAARLRQLRGELGLGEAEDGLLPAQQSQAFLGRRRDGVLVALLAALLVAERAREQVVLDVGAVVERAGAVDAVGEEPRAGHRARQEALVPPRGG